MYVCICICIYMCVCIYIYRSEVCSHLLAQYNYSKCITLKYALSKEHVNLIKYLGISNDIPYLTSIYTQVCLPAFSEEKVLMPVSFIKFLFC